MVTRSVTKAKTKAKDENSTFIVNSLLFFMNHRHNSTVPDSTLQIMPNYYNEESITEAKALLHNKFAPEKRLIKRKRVGKTSEILKDIHTMIVEMDTDPNNSIKLVTETIDFPTLDLNHIDAACLCHKILHLILQLQMSNFPYSPKKSVSCVKLFSFKHFTLSLNEAPKMHWFRFLLLIQRSAVHQKSNKAT